MKINTTGAPAARAKAGPRWIGALEGLHRGHLFGWAFDTEHPDARVALEICLDGEPVTIVLADVARTDLAGRLPGAADPCHGFVADLGAFELGESGNLTVRVANTDASIAGAVPLAAAATPPLAATSAVLGDGGLRLHGWAIDSANPRRNVTVNAYVGHERVATAVAALDHPALRSHEVGAHGFTLDLPRELADGRLHEVRVVDGQGNPLGGSPVSVCCFGAGLRALLPQAAEGLHASVIASYEHFLPRSLGMAHYAEWAAQFEPGDGAGNASGKLAVAVIVTGEHAPLLAATSASIAAQTHPHVTLFSARRTGKRSESFAALLKRVLASGCDAVTCIRAGDVLPAHALATALEGFSLPGAELVYTDSERAGQPWFKPAWNADYALASDYPLDLLLARADALRALLGAGAAPSGQASLCWQLLAQAWPRAASAIVHVPRVLCHCGAPLDEPELAARLDAARLALSIVEPAAALEAAAPVAGLGFAPRRVRRPLSASEGNTRVSLIIPTRDHADMLERCIGSIQRYSAGWPQLEIIVIDNGSVEAATRTLFRKLAKQGVKVMPMPGPFNFAALNNAAVEAATGDVVGLINNDIEALHDGWIDEMVSQLLRPGVGAVGAKLLWPNGMVQHGGVLLGVGNLAGHFGNQLADADWGDHGRNQLAQQVSGVTAACLFVRKRDYLAVGGMDAAAFPVAFNDVDLCLKIRASGLAITWTPYARLFHLESVSRGQEDTRQKRARASREAELLRRRWGPALLRDPSYHPSLNLDPRSQAFGGLALPPRERAPRTAQLAPILKEHTV